MEKTRDSEGPPSGADWDAMARYLAGESSVEERRAVEAWLAAHPADAALLSALDTTAGAGALDGPVDVEAALARVHARMDAPTVVSLDARRAAKAKQPSLMSSPWLRAAAVVTFLAVGGLLWKGRPGAVPTGAEPLHVATKVGARDSVNLPDGSRVMLAPGSELVVGGRYAVGEREVTLTGEAYFDVKHDEAHPFTIRAGGAIIRDIGTTFTVRSARETGVHVTVTSGAVSLRGETMDSAAAVTLVAGDHGALEGAGRVVSVKTGVTDAELAWMRDTLVFRDATLAYVGDQLRRWYGVDLRAGEAMSGRHVTATFDRHDTSIDQVLDQLSLTLGARFVRAGDTVTIRPPGGA